MAARIGMAMTGYLVGRLDAVDPEIPKRGKNVVSTSRRLLQSTQSLGVSHPRHQSDAFNGETGRTL